MTSMNGIAESVAADIRAAYPSLPASAIAAAAVLEDGSIQVHSTPLENEARDGLMDRPFFVASLTKSFTAATITRTLLASGVSELEPVTKWIPEYRTLLGDANFLSLLNHTAGLSDYVENMDVLNSLTDELSLEEATLRILATCTRNTSSALSYSNTGYMVAALALERLDGSSFESLFQSNVADPSDLTGTYFYDFNQRANAPALWQHESDWKSVQPSRYGIGWTDGAIVSTLQDLLKWARTIPHSIPKEILQNRSDVPFYHLGMNWEQSEAHGLCFWHSGAGPGIRSLLLGCVATGNAISFLSNFDCPNGLDPVEMILEKVFAKSDRNTTDG